MTTSEDARVTLSLDKLCILLRPWSVAISNSRIVCLEDGRVTFTLKDYADGNKTKAMTLEATEFIRRFLIHVVPRGFVRIRQFGFLANRNRKKKLAACRSLLASRRAVAGSTASPSSASVEVVLEKQHCCPVCKIGYLVIVEVIKTESVFGSSALIVEDTS